MMRATTALIALLGGFVVLTGAASAGPVASTGSSAEPAHGPGLPLQFLSAPIALTIAGHPAVLQVVRADSSPEAALDAVAAAWQAAGGLLRRDREGPWRNLSRVDRNGIQALQLRSAAGGSEGYLVGWRLAAPAAPSAAVGGSPGSGAKPLRSAAAPGAPGSLAPRLLPADATTLSDVTSTGESSGRTLVAWTPMTIAEVDRTVLARASQIGLKQRTEGRSADPDPSRERSRHFSGAGAELALTLHREGRGTALVIHLMEASR